MKKILFATMMACAGAFAADKTWTNGTGDGKWGTPGNWLDNAAPTASDTGYTITVSGTSENDIPGLTPTRLILAGSSAVRVTGESLALTDGVQFDATADATLVVPLVLSGAGQQTFGGSSAKTLYLMGVVSGSGGIEQTGAHALYLAGNNTFEGGFRQTAGRVLIVNGNAFGTGAVVFTGPTKVGTGYVVPFCVAAANLTIPNDIKFPRDGYNSGEGWKGSVELSAGTKFTGVCDFSAGGTRLMKYSGSVGGVITFANTVKLYPSTEAGNYATTFLPKISSACPLLFNGKMTGNGKVYQDNGSSLLQFAAAGNEILMHWLQGASMTIESKIADAFLPTTLVMFDGNASRTGQLFNLGGFDQTVNAVYDKDASVSYSHTVKGGGTARLTMKATADQAYAGQFTDDLTICWAPATAKTYTLTRTAFETTGGLVVSNGTVALASGASFPNATRLEVAAGATLSMAAGTAFNTDAAQLDLATGATLALADDVNLAFAAICVDGNRLSGGTTYSTANPIPGVTITGNGTVTVPEGPVPAARTAVWSGAGGANVRTDLAANWDGNAVPELADGLTAATFATGGTEAAVVGSLFLNGILFDAAGAFTLRSAEDSAAVRLQGGGIDTTAPTSGTRAYTVSAPVDVGVDQTWDVASGTTLTLSGRLAGETPTARLLRTGGGTVNLAGTDDYTGVLVISNGNTYVRGDGLGHTNAGSVTICDWPQGSTQVAFTDATVEKPVLFTLDSTATIYGNPSLLAFYGTNTFKAPVTLSGNYVRFRVADGAECRFAGGMAMAAGAVRYPVIKSVEGKLAGTGWFVVTNTPLDVTGWWQENANVVFAVAGNKFTVDGIYVAANSKLRIAVDGAVASSARLAILGTATLDLDGHDLNAGPYRNYATAAEGGSPRVTSAKAAALDTSVSSGGTANCWATFEDAAGLRKAGAGTFVLQRASSTTGTLEVAAGTLTFGTAGGWSAGREVKVGATGKIVVSRAKTIAREAVVRVASGGKIELAEGVTEHVAELWIGDARQSPGSYTKAKAPDLIAGAGTLLVGDVGTVVIIR